MALISLDNIKKDYFLGKTVIHALKGVSFSVEAGDFLSIVGPSGCGKSTLLNVIGCIDAPTSGDVFFNGVNSATLNDNEEAETRLHNIGFIFQAFNLVPVLTVFENIELPLILAGAPKTQRQERVRELLERVKLEEYEEHKPDELSGGQRQRVAIARALVNRPKLVIADEPTANLDSTTGEIILEDMRRMNLEENVTFIFSTHNPEIMEHAKRIIHLKDGEITGETAGNASRETSYVS